MKRETVCVSRKDCTQDEQGFFYITIGVRPGKLYEILVEDAIKDKLHISFSNESKDLIEIFSRETIRGSLLVKVNIAPPANNLMQ